MSFLRLIQRYKHFDFTGFVPITAQDKGEEVIIGWTKDDVARALGSLGDVWQYDRASLRLNPIYDHYTSRTEAVDANLLEASEQGILPEKPDYAALGMGEDDWFTVGPNRLKPLFEVRRFYTPFLGIRRYASRVNAYFDDQMWIAKRGKDVHQYPGFYDGVVGAGQVTGRTILENTLVEAHEEAGLSEEDCRDLRSVSMMHTFRHTPKGFLFDENIYVYDLDTKGTITPHVVQAWETESIELWSFDKVMEKIRHTDEFRPEAALCMIDFFIRHGYITPDNEPDYDALCFGLRSLYHYPTQHKTQVTG